MAEVGLFQIAIIGLSAGVLSDLLFGRRHDVFVRLLLGVAGAFVGEGAAQALDIPRADSFVGVVIAASLGAALLAGLMARLRRRPRA